MIALACLGVKTFEIYNVLVYMDASPWMLLLRMWLLQVWDPFGPRAPARVLLAGFIPIAALAATRYT